MLFQPGGGLRVEALRGDDHDTVADLTVLAQFVGHGDALLVQLGPGEGLGHTVGVGVVVHERERHVVGLQAGAFAQDGRQRRLDHGHFLLGDGRAGV